MDVLKSYAHQVVSYHPVKLRDDLFAEVYDELCEECADWLELNPGASEADFLDANREHPMKFATRLAAGEPAYLVGPQLYFSFISALKTGAVITAVFYLVLAAISAFASGELSRSMWQIFNGLPATLLWVCASILGVFIALEKSGERASWLDKWSAADLKSSESHQRISRGEALFDLGFSTFALLWLADIIQVPAFIRHDGEWITGWVTTLPDWFWVVAVVLLVFDVVYSLFRLTRSLWSTPLRITTMVTNLLWLGLLGFAILQPELLSVSGELPDKLQQLLPFANKAIRGVLGIICIILLWDTVSHAWRLKRQA